MYQTPGEEKNMLKEIKNRRSIRSFDQTEIDDQTINSIIEMGTWAPSGLNNQPWKFFVIRDRELKNELSTQTKYSKIIRESAACIAVFLDSSNSYDRTKDVQAIGACIQNMLLTIHHLSLGGVWLGEILNNRDAVEALLKVPDNLELMALVALGRPLETGGKGIRKPLDQMIIGRK